MDLVGSMQNIDFIFKSLDKRKLAICLCLEAFLDFIYYVVPFTFTLFLTMPFTINKALIVIGIFIISKTLRVVGNYLLKKYADNYLYEYSNLQYKLFYEKLCKIPVSVLTKYQTGYFNNIIEKISTLVSSILQAEYFSIILTFVFLFYTLWTQAFWLFIVSLLASVLCVYLSIKILNKGNSCVEELYEAEYIYQSQYNDFISNMKTVKDLNNNTYFLNKISEKGNTCYKKHKDYVKVYSLEEIVRNILIVLPFILGLLKAFMDLREGIDTLGLIAFYISLHVEMGFIFEELSRNIMNWFELKAIKKKISDIFKNLDTRNKKDDFREIELKNIVIEYPKTNLKIEVPKLIINKNDKVSITGKSGEGKTSLVNLILGNIECFRGNVLIDGENALNLTLDIGVVSQETELFNMSIKDNICLDKETSDEKILEYLKELELDEIELFEDGIDTIVGEKGLKLSTGEKRRLNILRSYLLNKNMYILDEPTSNLDKHTEEVVVDFILKYFQDKTLIIVTHNDKINKICNKFYRFKNHKLELDRGRD